MTEITAKSFNSVEDSRIFLDGSKRSVIVLESVAIGRGEYLPGWRWSLHAYPQIGKNSEAHIGYVLSGQMAVRSASGKKLRLALEWHLRCGLDMMLGSWATSHV